MNMYFLNLLDSKDENVADFESEHLASCRCSYLSPTDCHLCSDITLDIQKVTSTIQSVTLYEIN